MTDVELDAIEARANAATKGPWLTAEYAVGDEFSIGRMGGYWLYAAVDRSEPLVADAVFVAASRDDVPALITELRSARKRIAAAEAIAADWLQRAIADVENPASPAVAALTHDIQLALRGDD